MAVFLVTLVIILIYGHHRIYTLPAKKMGKAIFLRFGRNILLSRIKRRRVIRKEYCGKLVESRETLKGEYYASMVYNFMVKDGKKVWVPDCVEQFCQWGTPEDLKDYLFYTQAILGWSGQ